MVFYNECFIFLENNITFGVSFMINEDIFKKVKEFVLKIVEITNRLHNLGVVRAERDIVSEYVEWFCSKKFGLRLGDKVGDVAFSMFDEKVLIRSNFGSFTDFGSKFCGIVKVDYIFCVFLDKESLLFDSVYKISWDVVKDFLVDSKKCFEWKREARSLSLQVFPEENNRISL